MIEGSGYGSRRSKKHTDPTDPDQQHWNKPSFCKKSVPHKVHMYLEYHCVCPLVGRGGGVQACLRVRGWGSPNSEDWRKGLALYLVSILCNGWEHYVPYRCL
jgi:hypothetical protein